MARAYQLAIWMLVVVVLLGGVGCRRLTDAERRARAQIEVYVDKDLTAPKLHQPIGTWRAVHGQAIRRRVRSRYQCVLCHDPPRHCTKCHRQCGVWDAIDKAIPLATVQTGLGARTAIRRASVPLAVVPAAKRTANRSPRARPAAGTHMRWASVPASASGPRRAGPRAGAEPALPAVRVRVTTEHVEQMVQKLAERGQQMRGDGLPCLGEGNDLCLPCHTVSPSTARSLKPIHVTMVEGMRVGLTDSAPKGIRQPLCVDCHAYPLTEEDVRVGGMKPERLDDVLGGDLQFDMLRKPCVQRECHTDRDFTWALTFAGHMKQAIKHVPKDELFPVNTRLGALDGHVGRSAQKRAGVIVSWLLVFVMVAGACFLRAATERGSKTTDE